MAQYSVTFSVKHVFPSQALHSSANLKAQQSLGQTCDYCSYPRISVIFTQYNDFNDMHIKAVCIFWQDNNCRGLSLDIIACL